jgi:type VI secretion system protein ImpM
MNVRSDVATIPGWYGKLPSLGDFASRRLEADFIEPWDLWLAGAMQVHRQSLGDGWVEAYLDSPPWRFLLSPGVLRGIDSSQVFAGVLLPSVDRVGRYFPLTIAASLARVPVAAAEFEALLAWLHRLEDTALDALQGDWSIDDLERALADLGPPSDDAGHAAMDRLAVVRAAVAAAVAGGGGFVDLAGVASRAELASVFSPAPSGALAGAVTPALHGIALWIDDSPGRPQLLVSEGLPGHDDFARMFGGGSDASRGAAARGAAIDDDPLATLPQALDVPVVAMTGQVMAEATDLLGLFQGSAATTSPATAGPGGTGDGDILALFGAGDDAAPFEPGPVEAPKDDDILAMFEVPPETVPTTESPELPQAREAPAKEQDILDLFGGSPAAPDHGKGH